MIAAIASMARYTFLQQLRSRLYLVVILFGFLILASSLFFGALAPDQETRVILDLGLSAIELFALVASAFGAVTLVLEEIESRTIYLILTRPLPRGYFILGRFLGLLTAVAASMLIMSAIHGGLLLAKGWRPDSAYFLSLGFMFLKVAVMTAVAVFFSLSSTSAVASIVFTFFFWVLGHFGSEIRFLTEKSPNPLAGWIAKAFLFVTPNLEFLNYRDLFHAPALAPAQCAWALGYAILYTAACLSLSVAIFSRKEM